MLYLESIATFSMACFLNDKNRDFMQLQLTTTVMPSIKLFSNNCAYTNVSLVQNI
jgi:hypothetical protein